jgi:hypothetical protein
MNETLLILKLALKCLYFRTKTTFDAVNGQFISGVPTDLFILNPSFSVQRFAIDDITHTDSLVTEGDVSGLKKLYTNRLRAESQRRLETFLGKKELARFFDAYITNDTFHGPRVLAQRFFGSLTRPLRDFETKSDWHRWYREQKIAEVETMAHGRLRTTIAFRNRLHIYPFRQICSWQAIQKWAETGERDDISSYLHEHAAARRARIKNVIFMLETFDKFNLAFADDAEGARLGWSCDPTMRNVSWTVDGRERLILETTNEARDSTVGRAGQIQELQCIVNDQQLAHMFMEFFDYEWARLKKARDKRETIAMLESLYAKVR